MGTGRAQPTCGAPAETSTDTHTAPGLTIIRSAGPASRDASRCPSRRRRRTHEANPEGSRAEDPNSARRLRPSLPLGQRPPGGASTARKDVTPPLHAAPKPCGQDTLDRSHRRAGRPRLPIRETIRDCSRVTPRTPNGPFPSGLPGLRPADPSVRKPSDALACNASLPLGLFPDNTNVRVGYSFLCTT